MDMSKFFSQTTILTVNSAPTRLMNPEFSARVSCSTLTSIHALMALRTSGSLPQLSLVLPSIVRLSVLRLLQTSGNPTDARDLAGILHALEICICRRPFTTTLRWLYETLPIDVSPPAKCVPCPLPRPCTQF